MKRTKYKNPMYVFDDYLKSRFGYYAAGYIGELCGLLIGFAIGIGLLLLIF